MWKRWGISQVNSLQNRYLKSFHIWKIDQSTYGTGMRSNAHSGRIGTAKNLSPAIIDGSKIFFPTSRNSDSCSLLKQPGSMLNVHLITFSVVNRTEIYKEFIWMTLIQQFYNIVCAQMSKQCLRLLRSNRYQSGMIWCTSQNHLQHHTS